MVRGRRAASTAKCRVRHRPNASGPRSRIRAEEVQVECATAIHGGAAVTCYRYKTSRVSSWNNRVALEWSVRSASQGRCVQVIHLCCASGVSCLSVGVSRCWDAGGEEALQQDRAVRLLIQMRKLNKQLGRVVNVGVWITRVNIALRIRSRRMSNSEFVSIEQPKAKVAVT